MRKILVLLVTIGALSVFSQPVRASILLRDPQVGDTVQFWGQGDSSGGPFSATITYSGSGGGSTSWFTFCIEHDEYIYNNGTVYGMDATDPWTMRQAVQTDNWVMDQAKWLFHEFNSGALSTYSSSRVQDAIWYFTRTGGENGARLWNGATAESWTLINLANANYANWDSSNVRIMNPYREGNYHVNDAQSVLYEVIPEPATLIIWSLLGTLAITLGLWRKRKV
jgi:hypothetical protein